MAVRPIAAGDYVTTDYLGKASVLSTPVRQARLLQEKLFTCDCPRCCAPDATRAIPCPACCAAQHTDLEVHTAVLSDSMCPRDRGAAPSPDVQYAVPAAGGSEWRCDHCGGVWSNTAVCPDSRGRTVAEMRAQHALKGMLRPEDTDYACAVALRVLGSRHWATVVLLDWQCQALCVQWSSQPPPTELPPTCTGATDVCRSVAWYLDAASHVWAYCALTQVSPSLFYTAFCAAALALAVQLPSGALPRVVLQRALLCHALDVRCGREKWEGPALPRGFACLGLPTAGAGAAAAGLLREAGDAAVQSGLRREAQLWYQGLQLIDPHAALPRFID